METYSDQDVHVSSMGRFEGGICRRRPHPLLQNLPLHPDSRPRLRQSLNYFVCLKMRLLPLRPLLPRLPMRPSLTIETKSEMKWSVELLQKLNRSTLVTFFDFYNSKLILVKSFPKNLEVVKHLILKLT